MTSFTPTGFGAVRMGVSGGSTVFASIFFTVHTIENLWTSGVANIFDAQKIWQMTPHLKGKKLNEKLAEKLDESLSIVTNFTRIKYSFALLRTTLLCIRGSRSHKLSANMKEIDVSLAVSESRCV